MKIKQFLSNKQHFTKPFFSIFIPTYNRSADLQFALYCISQQSFSDYEIVVSDNCSTDNTKAIFDKLKDKRIHYFRNKKNIGMIPNQKKAIEYARGEYVFLHGDDDFLLYEDSLQKIYREIVKYNPGYIRVNYASMSTDKKRIFSYKVNKPFKANKYLPPFLENKEILSFIVDSDNYFFTGIIFRNDLPKSITMIDADPSPWINVLFYMAKNYGAYFIPKQHLIALWSKRKKKNEDHGFYNPVGGKLKAENYFEIVRRKISRDAYQGFLHKELITIYVNLFPAIKVSVGNKKMLEITRRICSLDPTMVKTITFWIHFIPTLFFPRSLLRIVKDTYLYLYTRFSKVDNGEQIISRFKELEQSYERI